MLITLARLLPEKLLDLAIMKTFGLPRSSVKRLNRPANAQQLAKELT